jgi:hypothetical protein
LLDPARRPAPSRSQRTAQVDAESSPGHLCVRNRGIETGSASLPSRQPVPATEAVYEVVHIPIPPLNRSPQRGSHAEDGRSRSS